MGSAYVLYAVVDRNGKLRRRGKPGGGGPGTLMVYESLAVAQRCANLPGDSVVEMTLNLDREPLFIRGGK